MLLTEKGKAVLFILAEILATIGMIIGIVCSAIFIIDVVTRAVAIGYLSFLASFAGVTIGLTVFFYIDEL